MEEQKLEVAESVVAPEVVVEPVAETVSEAIVEPAPAPVKGVKELIELLDLLLDAHSVVKQALSDGKVGLGDAALLFKLVPQIGPAVSGLSEVPAEVKDLTAAEAGQVVAHVMAKLAVEDAKARAIIAASLKVVVDGVELAKAISA